LPALKAADTEARVIYLGSLSKSMFPGLRLGYIVANQKIISELRSLRRLMLRHVPSNNQRTTSLFIAQGHHESYLRKLNKIYSERSLIMKECLEEFFPKMGVIATYGGTSYWLKGSDNLDADKLSVIARDHGIVIESGSPHFLQPAQNRNYLRLGFSSINTADIKPGLKLLADLMG
jgi:GntR family transcriptional regulator/MocR family aminotransferase